MRRLGLGLAVTLTGALAGGLGLAASATLSVLLTACGAPVDRRDPNASDGSGSFVGSKDAAVPKLLECAESTKDVYVLAEDRTLRAFHPPTSTFTNKGLIRCEAGAATPTSMAIDRTGIAWVRYSDGTIWKVSTTTLVCEATSFLPQTQAFKKFGMGFATETKGGSAEVLYLSDSSASAGLGRLEPKTLAIDYIGPHTGVLEGASSELTGTGDGNLYGFFTTIPARVAEISKATGGIISVQDLPGVNAGTAWAFSFYGGDFYIYTHGQTGGLPRDEAGSDVTRYRPSDGTVEVVLTKIGFKIVGAGVSTCAPTSMPR